MKDTTKIKEELKRVLRSMPQDFTLFEARRYISLAISKIEAVESKRNNRLARFEQRKEATALKREQIKKVNGAKDE